MKKISNHTLCEIAGGTDWCIAGGYAACPALAGDCDVWIYGIDKDDLDTARQSLLVRLADDIEPQDNPERDDPEAYLGACYTLKVGVLGLRHILVTSAGGVRELLDGFDISTHQCAITSEGAFVAGDNWTQIWRQPHVLRVGGAHTADRLIKIVDRYFFLRAAHTNG